MEYKFSKMVVEFTNSQDKIKEVRFWDNEGKWDDADIYLGAYVFYKNGTRELVLGGKNLVREELNYLNRHINRLEKAYE